METFTKFLEIELFNIGKYHLKTYHIFIILIIFIATRLILWLIKKAMFRKHKADKTDIGNTYAIYQIISYILWLISFAIALQALGIRITVLLAGSAALLVGIGLGLQQTFNDIVSGIILLSERSIKVGDILEIDGDVIKILSIGLRTSKGLNRDEISIIIPNSLITTNKVINWSHQSNKTRFKINIGVAYGSDVNLVIKVLQESALQHPDIFDKEHVEARLVNFGSSSLDFQLLFFSQNIFRIEKVKSEIRKIINEKFIENNISIPFPQVDLHMKSQ
jgi:small-conductance mechanosensitive channel